MTLARSRNEVRPRIQHVGLASEPSSEGRGLRPEGEFSRDPLGSRSSRRRRKGCRLPPLMCFHIRAAVVVLVTLTAFGCASRTTPPRSPSGSGGALHVREGLASYYADWFNGRTTASGTIFSNDDLVAAHPSYPFGSVVRVVNLRNQRSIALRVVDRGPAPAIVARGVIIDVSRAAAERLGFINAGRTRVRVEVLRWGDN